MKKKLERICRELVIAELKVLLWYLLGKVRETMRNLRISGVLWFAVYSMICVELMDKITK
jgi:hypothetical protein